LVSDNLDLVVRQGNPLHWNNNTSESGDFFCTWCNRWVDKNLCVINNVYNCCKLSDLWAMLNKDDSSNLDKASK
jgi:hypothetical protein